MSSLTPLKIAYLFFILVFLPLLVLAQQPSQSFESIMKSANEKFIEKDYISAKTYYEMALRIKENDPIATKKVAETVVLIKKQLELQEKFYQQLDLGDKLFSEGKLDQALQVYTTALLIFPEDKYVKSQVKKINDSVATARKTQLEFETYMQLGETLFKNKKYEEAILQFSQAAALFPENNSPSEKMKQANVLLNEQLKNEQRFGSLIAEAELQISRKNYSNGIEKIKEALAVFPDDIKAKKLLTDANNQLNKTNQYTEILTKADDAYAQKNIKQAHTLYEQARAVFPDQAYPNDMISRINQMLNSDEYHKEVTLKKLLAEANQLYANQQFDAALKAFTEVAAIEPENKMAGERIVEISFKLKQFAAQKDVDLQFNNLKLVGNKAFTEKNLLVALSSFNKAKVLKAGDQEVESKIVEIEKLLSDEKSAQTIAEKYDVLIASADQLLAKNDLVNAKSNYQEAVKLNETAIYPKEQIKKIDALLIENASAEQAKLQFNNIMAEGETHLKNKNFRAAQDAFKQAINIQPDSQIAKSRFEAVSRNLSEETATNEQYAALMLEGNEAIKTQKLDRALAAFNNASKLKPLETQPKQKIDEINNIVNHQLSLTQKENEYASSLAQAETQLKSKNYEAAIELYRHAKTLFADREYPTAQIDQITSLINANKAAEAINNQYSALIQEASNLYNNNNLAEAKTKYTDALALKPTETHPKTQLDNINNKLTIQAKETERQNKYDEKIGVAEQLFAKTAYEEAINAYREALQIKPNEQYPETQIRLASAKIEAIANTKKLEKQITDLKIQGESYFVNRQFIEAMASFDQLLKLDAENNYAIAKKTEIALALESISRENQKKYEEAIAEGDKQLSLKEYQMAMVAFQSALGFKANDTYAGQRIKQTEAIMKERLLILKTEYNKIIAEADIDFNAKNYDKAIEAYLKAEGVKPDERYPREMIRKIATIIEENKIRDLISTPTAIAANVTKRIDFEMVDIAGRRTNYILIKAKNNGKTAFPLLVNFGSKSGRNGGFVLPIPAKEGYNDFVVRIGSQYKWFSEDNTWLELLPEDGSIEISLIQISKGN